MRVWKIFYCILIIFITMPFFITIPLYGVDDDNEEEKTITDAWKEILLYGISDQILEVIKDIRNAKETELNKDLIKVLSESINSDVLNAILEYFIEIEYPEASDVAVRILNDSEENESSIIKTLIKYLAVIGSEDLKEILLDFIDAEQDAVSIAAIEAIGIIKDNTKVNLLLEKLEDAEFPSERKPTIILVLGDLQAKEAVDKLLKIVADPYSEKIWRMYASNSLGKIGDKKAIDELKKLFSDKDALIRAYAASALAEFNLEDVISVLIQGLKDSNWKVRYYCASSLARVGADKAIDILKFKVLKDPILNVKKESIRALGEIGDIKCFNFLKEIYENEKQSIDLRYESLKILVKNDLSGSINVFKKMIDKEWEKSGNNIKMLEMTAKELSLARSPVLKEVFKKFIKSPGYVIRIYGIRGIANNNFTDLLGTIEKLSKEDPALAVRREALTAIKKMQ